MIFNEMLSTYFGWCPKFNVPLAEPKQTPITNLSSIGKTILIIFLILLGVDNLKNYNTALSYFYTLSTYHLSIIDILYLIIPILSITSPFIWSITLLILVADCSLSKKILKRHRIELAILFSSQALYNILIVISHLNYKDIWNYDLFASTIFATLLFYISDRVLKNKRILNRTTFLILSIFFIEQMIGELINYPWSLLYTDRYWMRLVLIVEWEIICGVAAYFCLKVYRDIGKNASFVLSFPWYVRLIAVVYALGGLKIDQFLFTWNFDLYRIPSDWFFGYLLYYAKYAGLVAVSFLPLRFNVGENINNPLEVKNEVS